MLAVRRPRVWMLMVAPHLLRRRHRAMTILISPPFCAARRREDCYSSHHEKGPGLAKPGPSFLAGSGSQVTSQDTDFKPLIIYFMIRWPHQTGSRASRNLVKL
jgi:hypothetical protein